MNGINTERLPNEDFDAYALRLYSNKTELGLNSEKIAKLLNTYSEIQKDESSWRKHYTSFKKGIDYAVKNNIDLIANRILALSDFHYPFQLDIETFSDYRNNVDVLVLNGDMLDCQSISKFDKLYRIPIKEELIGGRQYIIDLINYINPKDVYVTIGNHEKRLASYLAKNMPELADLEPDNALDYIVCDGFYSRDKRTHTKSYYEPLTEVYRNSGISIHYDGNWYCKVGKTIFAHPLAFSSGMLKTTDKAVNYFFRTSSNFDSVVLGHTHQLGYYVQGGIYLYEQGTCSNTDELDYMDGRLTSPQQRGFIYICQDKNGNNLANKTKLITIK